MLIEILFLAAALIGTAAGGWIDLKTTEIPDIVPASMVGIGFILHIANCIMLGSFHSLLYAIGVSAIYLAFGYLLYYTGQWGEADVLLLAATIFLIPQPLSFFNITAMEEFYPLVFILNTFIIGGIYSVIYSVVLAVKKPQVFSNFYKDVRRNIKKIATALTLVTAALISITFILTRNMEINIIPQFLIIQLAFFVPTAATLILLYRFAIVLDNTSFKSKIPVSKLRDGDVLAEDIKLKDITLSGKLFIGLTDDQIKLIKKEKTHVNIKEGIRYGPTFFLTILFTWFFGNSIFILFAWI